MAIADKVHEYQIRGASFMVKNYLSYDAVDAGLGKTLMTLLALKRIQQTTKLRALIVAPLSVVYNTWPREIKKWKTGFSWTILHGPYKDQNINYDVDLYLINYDGLKWFHSKVTQRGQRFPKCALVLDESTFVKSHKTKRFKVLKALQPLYPYYRFCLSASPMPNGYHDLWSQYFLLDGGKALGQSFPKFRDTYFNYMGPPVYKTTIRPGAAEVIEQKIAPLTFRLDAKDHLELPDLIYNEIYGVLPTKLMDMYKQLERDFFVRLFESDTDIIIQNAAALSNKLRQLVQGAMYTTFDRSQWEFLHSTKLDMLKEFYEATPTPILCPIYYKFEVELIKQCREFKKAPVIAGGKFNKAHETTRILREWNAGNIPILFCNAASVAHGLNIQDSGYTIYWHALTWVYEHYFQLIRRLWRQGQKSKTVVVHHAILKGTIDELMLRRTKSKDRTQNGFLQAMKNYANKKGYL